ncbi:MAG: Carbohydrate-selective porin OprB [Planctomycetaceae bacterium]|nr:Carbohydrate-selective porin OprB [Planctomycetaceae bacterium]
MLLWTSMAAGQQFEDMSLGEVDLPETDGGDLDLWSREKLTGDWYGRRGTLAASGLAVNFNTTYVFQGVAGGGFEGPFFSSFSNEHDTGNTLGGDLQMELDTGQAGWWEGGKIRTRVQSRTGRSILERAGTLAAVNNEAVFPIVLDRFDRDALAITELSYEHTLTEQVAVFGGLLNTSMGDENAIGGSALSHAHFLNFAMLYSLVEDATVPHASLGGGINFTPAENVSGSFTVFGSAETAGENPFNLWHGTTFSTEWTFGHTVADRAGAQTFGLLYGINARRTDIAADPRLVLIGILAGLPIPTTITSTWALYYNAHQFLVGNAEHGWGLFTRLGLSDGNPNFVKWNFSGGVGGIGLLPGRQQDNWGLGVYYLDMSNEDLLRGLGVTDEVGSEAYYTINVSPAFHVTLDAQVIDSGLPGEGVTCILGLRTHFDF